MPRRTSHKPEQGDPKAKTARGTARKQRRALLHSLPLSDETVLADRHGLPSPEAQARLLGDDVSTIAAVAAFKEGNPNPPSVKPKEVERFTTGRTVVRGRIADPLPVKDSVARPRPELVMTNPDSPFARSPIGTLLLGLTNQQSNPTIKKDK